ncbi:MAG: hypothetical protein ABI389_12485 [Rhodanobacter sp.]
MPLAPPVVELRAVASAERDWRARAARQQRRWHEPPVTQATRRFALGLVLLLHGVFALVTWYGMRPPPLPVVRTTPDQFMQVRFIDTPLATSTHPPAPPPPPLLPFPPRTPPVPPAKGAMVVQSPPVAATAPRLFDAQGRPLLPASAASAPTPGYVQRMPQGDARIMQHDSSLKYQPTRFADDWDRGGSSVDHALQKLVDKTTVKKTVRLPGGIRVHCAMSLAMLAGGCRGDPPPPPSAKDGDVRLNMAPASSLDGRAHAVKPPSVEACIAMYRAGKPLVHGCPVDTPNRSVDAELREHAVKGAAHP